MIQFHLSFYNESNATEKKLYGTSSEEEDDISSDAVDVNATTILIDDVADEDIDNDNETDENFDARMEKLNLVMQDLIDDNNNATVSDDPPTGSLLNDQDDESMESEGESEVSGIDIDENGEEENTTQSDGVDFDFDGFLNNLTKREELARSKEGKSFRSRLVGMMHCL
jgi:hypothetical protein